MERREEGIRREEGEEGKRGIERREEEIMEGQIEEGREERTGEREEVERTRKRGIDPPCSCGRQSESSCRRTWRECSLRA